MSEYIPTTEEVRNGFANNQFLKSGQDVAYLMEFAGTHQKEFDRWLAQRDAEVAEAERQRIIELLQREASEWISKGKEDLQLIALIEDLRLIALIKGENQ